MINQNLSCVRVRAAWGRAAAGLCRRRAKSDRGPEPGVTDLKPRVDTDSMKHHTQQTMCHVATFQGISRLPQYDKRLCGIMLFGFRHHAQGYAERWEAGDCANVWSHGNVLWPRPVER